MYAAESAIRYPNRTAIVVGSTGEKLTFAEYEAQCNQLARLFADLGLRHGDRIAVMGENSPMIFVGQGAAERSGLYYVPVNYHFTAGESADVINENECSLVIVDGRLADTARQLRSRCPAITHWLMIDPPPGETGYSDLRKAIADYAIDYLPDERLGMAVLYSSGTTGRPKGVIRPLADVGPNQAREIYERVANDVYRVREGMVYLVPGPNYHATPYVAVSMSLRHGGTCVVMDRFDPEQFLKLIEEYRVTHVAAVPTMLYRVMNLPVPVRAAADVSSIEVLLHTGGPCSIELKNRLIEWFGPKIRETYGATDVAGVTLATSEDSLAHPGTVGRALLGEVVVLDHDDRPCPPGVPGEIAWKTEPDFTFANDEDNSRGGSLTPGDVRRCGDLGYQDADGYLYVTGRKDFTIISGGANIYPKEIEDVLLDHRWVNDVAVIGVPSEDRGQEVKAVVELHDGSPEHRTVIEELTAHCRARLAAYKCPRHWQIADALPRTAMGKLRQVELRELYGRATIPPI